MKKEISVLINLTSEYTGEGDELYVSPYLLSDKLNSLLIKYEYVDLKKLSNDKYLFIEKNRKGDF